jgi:large subunit ribosomal protein L4
MKQAVLNTTGEKAGELELPEKVFGMTWNPDLVHQVAVIQQGNRRQVSAKVKDRGEVRGGGKKPWRQKGTGRARHGSSRSPIWTGGGVTHGPTTERNYKRKLNVKMRRKALLSALSEKFRQQQVIILDSLSSKEGKTKELATIFQGLPLEGKSTLLVLATLNQNLIRACRNIPYVRTIQAREMNLLDVMTTTYIVFEKESLSIVEKTFAT